MSTSFIPASASQVISPAGSAIPMVNHGYPQGEAYSSMTPRHRLSMAPEIAKGALQAAREERLAKPGYIEELEKEWGALLAPIWKYVSHLSPTPILSVYARIIARTGFTPTDVSRLLPQTIKSNCTASVQTIATARLGVHLRTRLDAQPPSLKFVSESTEDDLSFQNLKISGYVSSCRGIVKEDALLTLSGPEKLIQSEEEFHKTLLIPSAIVFTFVADVIHRRTLESTAADFKHPASYNIHTSLAATIFYLDMFAIAFAVMQVIACNYARLDDRLASHYLSIPFMFRFLDLLAIFLSFVVIGPWEAFTGVFGESSSQTTGMQGWGLWGMMLAMCVMYQMLMAMSIGFTVMRMNSAFFPVNAHELVSAFGEDALSNPKPRMRDRVWGFIFKVVRCFGTSEDRRLAKLRAIGRYRRLETSLVARDKIVEEMAIRAHFGTGSGEFQTERENMILGHESSRIHAPMVVDALETPRPHIPMPAPSQPFIQPSGSGQEFKQATNSGQALKPTPGSSGVMRQSGGQSLKFDKSMSASPASGLIPGLRRVPSVHAGSPTGSRVSSRSFVPAVLGSNGEQRLRSKIVQDRGFSDHAVAMGASVDYGMLPSSVRPSSVRVSLTPPRQERSIDLGLPPPEPTPTPRRSAFNLPRNTTRSQASGDMEMSLPRTIRSENTEGRSELPVPPHSNSPFLIPRAQSMI